MWCEGAKKLKASWTGYSAAKCFGELTYGASRFEVRRTGWLLINDGHVHGETPR